MKSIRILFYNIKKVILTVAVVFISVILFSIFWLKASPLYESKAVVTFLPTEFEIRFQDGRSDLAGLNAASVLTQTHTEFLLSRSLAESVIMRALEKHTPPAPKPSLAMWVNSHIVAPAKGYFWMAYFTLNSGKFVPPTQIEDLTGKLMDRMEIKNVPASYILSISVEWDDPEFARILAELLTDVYIERVAQNNDMAIDQTLTQLNIRADSIQAQLGEINKRIRDFKKGEKLFVLSKTVEFKMDEMKSFLEQYNEQRMRVLALQGELKNKKNLLTSTDSEKMKADLKLAQEMFKDLESLIAGKQKELGSMPGKEFDFENLMTEKENYRSRLARVFDDIGRTKLAKTVGVEPVKIIDPPLAAPYPKSPKILINAAAGLLLGLMLAFGWILSEEYLRPRVRSTEDMDPRLHTLGVLPPAPKPEVNSSGTLLKETSSSKLFDPHLRYLRDRILQGNNSRIVAVESLGAEAARSQLVEDFFRPSKGILVIDLKGDIGAVGMQKRADLGSFALNGLDPAKWRAYSTLEGGASKTKLEFILNTSEFSSRELQELETLLANLNPETQVIINLPFFKEFPIGYRINQIAEKVVLLVAANSTPISQVTEYLEINKENIGKTQWVLADVKYHPDLIFKV